MTNQLPVIIPPATVATPTDTPIVPALIAHAGDHAVRWDFLPIVQRKRGQRGGNPAE